jgi:arylsulfatase A-like enzyme
MQGLSEHVDIVPTVLDLLGLSRQPQWGMQGESLLPMLSGQGSKRAVFADGGHEQEMWARFNCEASEWGKLSGKQQTYQRYPESMARTKMVRSEDWKLIIRLAGENELYDLRRDPDEMDNFVEPAFR